MGRLFGSTPNSRPRKAVTPHECFVLGPGEFVSSMFSALGGAALEYGEERVGDVAESPTMVLTRVVPPPPPSLSSPIDAEHRANRARCQARLIFRDTTYRENRMEKSQTPGGWEVLSEYRFYLGFQEGNSLVKTVKKVRLMNDKFVVLILHSAKTYCTLPDQLREVLTSKVSTSVATLLFIDCSDSQQSDTSANNLPQWHTLNAIQLAFSYCASKMMKWKPTPDTVDEVLSLISGSAKGAPKLYMELSGDPAIPTILDITCSDASTAHMIMQLVHDYRSQFPFFTVTMALRTWLRAKNEAALGVVCLAHTLTESENIDLSDLNLDSVPQWLKILTFQTLNLSSNNKIHEIPKWLAESPNVRLGRGYERITVRNGEEISCFHYNNTHKLVIVGDTGVGKTTLLRCIMEGKKKLTKIKHVHTGITVHYDVQFKENPTNWTIWDLGGESMIPFHQWFLLSRSVFIIVFDVSKALMMKEPHMAVYRWLNEISVARSRGAKTKGTIIPVGTHMEGIDPNDPKISEVLTRIFMYEDVPCAILLQLSNGNAWRCDKSSQMRRFQWIPLYAVPPTIFDDGVLHSVPQAWIILKCLIIKIRERDKISWLKWTQFVGLAKECGVHGRKPLEIEKCANFLADIGTIVHFRYPFWLLSQHSEPNTEGLSDLVIVEPRSFLSQLVQEVQRLWLEKTTIRGITHQTSTSKAALTSILDEFSDIHRILSYSSPLPSIKECVSFLPIVANRAPVITLENLWVSTSATVPEVFNGRSLKFPVFTQEMFFKAISKISRFLMIKGWISNFCWSDAFLLSHPCKHDEIPLHRQALLFMTFQDATVSICMRSECNKHWTQTQQQSLWGSLMNALYSLQPSRFEEESDTALFPGVVELFPCTHCLLQGGSHWKEEGRPAALQPNLFYFTKEDILRAVKNGEQQLCCGKGKCSVAEVAPNIVALHQDPTPPSRSEILVAAEIVPPPLSSMAISIGTDVNLNKGINLADLLRLLIEKGDGTTSILDQVLPISVRLRMLHNVACALQSLHSSQNCPNVHTKISSDNIIVLSLDESSASPLVKIMAPHAPFVYLSEGYYQRTEPISLSDLHFHAPEILSGLKFDTQADVWSFGILASVLLYPLKRPYYPHITNNNKTTNKKYLFTDYSSTSSHNNNHEPRLYPWSVCRDLRMGLITPFPPTTSKLGSGTPTTDNDHHHHRQQNKLWRLGNEIVGMCLEPNPIKRPPIKTVLTVWDYFV
ncbi:hypothetical protein Pelo_1418 [Pelomyxa schiedti]|nr:hypothetical protein Pelo_1418 [Pelomyxa schiedti]